MRMCEFQFLSCEEQLSILYQQGVYIGKKKADQFSKLLFQLESFYVEITYVSYRLSIHEMRFSESTLILDPYIEQIDVEFLVT